MVVAKYQYFNGVSVESGDDPQVGDLHFAVFSRFGKIVDPRRMGRPIPRDTIHCCMMLHSTQINTTTASLDVVDDR